MPVTVAVAPPIDADARERKRWVALVVLCAGVLMTILDGTIVNAALPSIQTDLGFTQADLAWVVNAYVIACGGLLLLAGRLGDVLGRKRVFVAGLVLFTAASLVCGLAHDRGLLIGARFVQGAGGALTSAVVLGMVVTLFPAPREQARAIGVYSFFQAAGGSVGLLLGGALTQAISWHWIFYVNVPLGVATALAAVRLLDRDDEARGLRDGADAPGALLIVSALMLGSYVIVGVDAHGWSSSRTLVLGAMAAVLLSAFVVRESRTPSPLMPLRLFRAGAVAGANLLLALLVAGLFAMQFLVPLYLRRVLGYDAVEIGLAFLPVPLAIAAFSLGLAGRLITRLGAAVTLVPGLVLIAGGLAILARAPAEGQYLRDILPSMLLLGFGGGLALPSLMTLAMAGVAAEDSGLASGLANTTIQVGGALGLAVLVTLATARTDHLHDGGHGFTAALLGGYHLGFAIGAGLVVAAILITVFFPFGTGRRRAYVTASRRPTPPARRP
jgi:EmrB/QacA subfamily drug resistance transporter